MLSDLQRQKLIRYFRLYDVDDDGSVAWPDFERVVENVRILYGLENDSAGHKEIRAGYARRWEALRQSADLDHDDMVDVDEWLGYWEAVISDPHRYDDEIGSVVSRLYEIFDTDGDGSIGADEFCNFYGVYGLKSALARQVFMDLDKDGDGQLSRQEILEMADDFYRSDDSQAPGNQLFGPLG